MPGVIGFCWWNEGWQNDDHKKHDTDMIILHDVDLTRVFAMICKTRRTKFRKRQLK